VSTKIVAKIIYKGKYIAVFKYNFKLTAIDIQPKMYEWLYIGTLFNVKFKLHRLVEILQFRIYLLFKNNLK